MFCKNLAFLLVLLAPPTFADSPGNLIKGPTGIHNGIDTLIKDHPYAAAILDKKGNLLCNGVLISDVHILTASHCIYPYSEESSNKTDISMGTNYYVLAVRNPRTLLFHIKEVFIAVKWNDTKDIQNHDLAVVLMDRPYTVDGIADSIAVPEYPPPKEGLATVIGWGTTGARYLRQHYLQKLTVKINNKEDMKHELPFEVQDYHILTESPTEDPVHKLSCVGDNGSFLIYNNTVIGVSTKSVPCTSNRNLGVFTSVYHNLKAIDRIYVETICLPEFKIFGRKCPLLQQKKFSKQLLIAYNNFPNSECITFAQFLNRFNNLIIREEETSHVREVCFPLNLSEWHRRRGSAAHHQETAGDIKPGRYVR
ncbi:trypsin-like [Prorops nasuta]|uniref:trypsin-like n=1 Tax=Prorops nasuta TaxID=863751 RepID=UPI0034CD47E1